jgi:hypothetical protein
MFMNVEKLWIGKETDATFLEASSCYDRGNTGQKSEVRSTLRLKFQYDTTDV